MDMLLKTMATTSIIEKLEKGALKPDIKNLNQFVTSADILKKAMDKEGFHRIAQKILPSVIFRHGTVPLRRYLLMTLFNVGKY